MAPVEICPVNSSSAARPPKVAHISSSICSLVVICRSSGKYHAAPNARPRGTMVTLIKGLACSKNQDSVAWPASCKAIVRFSSAVMILVFFSKPPIIRSTASRKSCFPTAFLPWRAAISAASLHTLAISAPLNPGVWRASKSRSTLSSSFKGFKCTPNTSLRSFKSGKSTWIWRSKRPARNNALSNISARLVAAKMITPLFEPKPSISVNNWFNVFSRSSFPPMLGFLPRARPTASISSMKIMQGAFSFAWRNKSRTRDAPTPTNISTKSEPESEKKGTSASPATAFASKVLPVPGGPTSKAPLGILPPSSVYFWGCFRNSTISSTSCLASACPATSLKVIRLVLSPFSYTWALLLPTLNGLAPPAPAPPLMRRMANIQIPINSKNGAIFQNNAPK